jgi:hypothetical protein
MVSYKNQCGKTKQNNIVHLHPVAHCYFTFPFLSVLKLKF